jgi:hypothetical protein
LNQEELGGAPTGKQSHGDFRGGAIAGECNLTIYRVTSRKKNTGMK